MFGWLRKGACDFARIDCEIPLDTFFQQEVVILFKHSPTCIVSWAAHAQVTQFRAAHPEIPVYLVSVREERDLSRRIAEHTRVRHASPQIIVVGRGEVLSVASHEEITAAELASMTVSR